VRTRIIIALALAGLVALGVLWFRQTFEKQTVKEWVGASGEARTRQFLAAQRFAQRMGWKATEARSLPALDQLPKGGTLLLPNRRQAFTAERIAELARWAENGGHLVVEAEFLGVPDPLLDRLGVQRAPIEAVPKTLAVEIPRQARKLTVAIPGSMKLAWSQKEVRLRAGEQLVSFGRGRGVVTATTSLGFARNRAIGNEDHAELFYHLLALAPGQELVVYWSPARLSLWQFLKENAAPALVAGALLLALWLWSIAPRFGPVAPDAPPGRRRLLDHLRASGRYFWARGLRSRLVVAARDAALRRVARAQPDFAAASAAEKATRISSLAGISREDAARFIHAAGALRGLDFIKVTHHAQRIHSALEKGRK
jgi:hypothetical protein